MLHCCGLMCAVCGCKSIIYRHMHCSLWNLSIIDSASPIVGTLRGLSIAPLLSIIVCVLRIWVCMLMWKSILKEAGERLMMWGRSIAQCSAVQCTLSLAPSLFQIPPNKGAFSLIHLPSSLLSHRLYFSGCICHFLFFYITPPQPPPLALLLYSKNGSSVSGWNN